MYDSMDQAAILRKLAVLEDDIRRSRLEITGLKAQLRQIKRVGIRPPSVHQPEPSAQNRLPEQLGSSDTDGIPTINDPYANAPDFIKRSVASKKT